MSFIDFQIPARVSPAYLSGRKQDRVGGRVGSLGNALPVQGRKGLLNVDRVCIDPSCGRLDGYAELRAGYTVCPGDVAGREFAPGRFLLTLLAFAAFPAQAQDAGTDGIVAVLTAPVDAAIDVTFAAIGYDEGDDDE